MKERKRNMRNFLVGSCRDGSLSSSELLELRTLALNAWSLRKGLKISSFRVFLLLLEFEDGLVVERVLVRVSRRFREIDIDVGQP